MGHVSSSLACTFRVSAVQRNKPRTASGLPNRERSTVLALRPTQADAVQAFRAVTGAWLRSVSYNCTRYVSSDTQNHESTLKHPRWHDRGINQTIFHRTMTKNYFIPRPMGHFFLPTSQPIDPSSIDLTDQLPQPAKHLINQPMSRSSNTQPSTPLPRRNPKKQHALPTWFSVLSSLSELSSSVSIALSHDTVGTMLPVAPSPAG